MEWQHLLRTLVCISVSLYGMVVGMSDRPSKVVLVLCLCVTACGSIADNESTGGRRTAVLVSPSSQSARTSCVAESLSLEERVSGLPRNLRATEAYLRASALELTLARFGSEREPLPQDSIPVEIVWSMRARTPCAVVAGFAALQVSLQDFTFDDPAAVRFYASFMCDEYGEGCVVRMAGPAAVPASQEFSERISQRAREANGTTVLELRVVAEWTYAGDDRPVVESFRLSVPGSP